MTTIAPSTARLLPADPSLITLVYEHEHPVQPFEFDDTLEVWRVTARIDADVLAEELSATTDMDQEALDAVEDAAVGARVRRWAHGILSDPHLVVLDVQTTTLTDPWAVQIGLTDRHGVLLFNEHLNPLADIAPAATELHGITQQQAATSAPFAAIVPRLAQLLHGRRCLTYNAAFDRRVLERELHRHFRSSTRARDWLRQCTWVDAMRPYAAWKGLWSARRRCYRYQPLGSSYEAITNCRLLLTTLEQVR